jgi:hypothetical protein
MTAAMALPAIFKALMTTFQKPADCIRRRHRGARACFFLSLSRKRKPLKAAKNSPGVLQSYVTYDTLQGATNLKTTHFERF